MTMKKATAIFMTLVMLLSVAPQIGFVTDAVAAEGETIYSLTPGTSAATAAKIAVGETVYGSFSAVGTYYYYSFNLTGAAVVTVNLNFTNSAAFAVYRFDGSNYLPVLAGPATAVTAISGYTSITVSPSALEAGQYIICVQNNAATASAAGDSFNFTVSVPTTPTLPTLTISETEISLNALTQKQLKITVGSPADLNVFWESADTSIATVDANGVVTANFTTVSKTVDIRAVVFYRCERHFIKCKVTIVPPALSINSELEINMLVGSKFTFIAVPSPLPAIVNYASDNPAVVSVDGFGSITALSSGSAKITISYMYFGYKIYKVVTVNVGTTDVSGVTISNTEPTVAVGGTMLLTAVVAPGNAANKAVKWSSSDTTVATVDEITGAVSGIKLGTAIITVTTVDGGFTASCTLTVTQPVESVSLDITAESLEVGATRQLTATVLPENASNKEVTYSSSNPAVATVSETGLVTAVSGGTATITVATVDGGKTATYVLTVPVHATGVSLNVSSKVLSVGGSYQLTAFVLPENASNKAVTYSSDNSEIASVSATGLVTANKVGTATITVTTADGSFTASCAVTVRIIPTVTIKTPSVTTINYGETLILHAITDINMPEDAKIVWSLEGSGVSITPAENYAGEWTCKVTSTETGTATVVATVVDASGAPIKNADGTNIFASQTITSRVNLWYKIVNFFRGLFGMTVVIAQSVIGR